MKSKMTCPEACEAGGNVAPDDLFCANSGRSSNANWDKSSATVQPIIIGCVPPKFLKSLSGTLADFRLQKGTQFGRGPRVSVGRCRCFPQDFL
jgi:hypothetical protein